MEQQHLTKEKLEQFLRDELSGEESMTILIHLDECQQCRNLLPERDAKEIIANLLRDDNDDGKG